MATPWHRRRSSRPRHASAFCAVTSVRCHRCCRQQVATRTRSHRTDAVRVECFEKRSGFAGRVSGAPRVRRDFGRSRCFSRAATLSFARFFAAASCPGTRSRLMRACFKALRTFSSSAYPSVAIVASYKLQVATAATTRQRANVTRTRRGAGNIFVVRGALL